MELKDKIELLINEIGYTSSTFADLIDVSRPKISHILANRNKPSWEILQKIINRFPSLGTNWVLDNEVLDLKKIKELKLILQQNESKEEVPLNTEIDDLPELPLFNQHSSVALSENLHTNTSKIKKIVVFYEDNTFSEFLAR